MSDLLFIPDGRTVPAAAVLGGKAHNLARLGADVPRWFAVPTRWFGEVAREGDLVSDTRAMQDRAEASPIPEALRSAVEDALRTIHLTGRLLAVRSSATAEDAAAASFAGQFDTVLGVRGDTDAVLDAIRRVWASAFSAHARAYAGADDSGRTALAMAVIVQELVEATVSGVAFGADPVTGDPEVAVVSAVYGLGEGLVSGAMDADTWTVRASPGARRPAPGARHPAPRTPRPI